MIHNRLMATWNLAPWLLLAGCMGWSLTGCRSDSRAPRKVHTAERILLVGVGKNHPSFAVLQATARQISGHKRELTIDVLAPEHVSPAEQQALLEGLSPDRYDAICIQPVDPESIGSTMQRLASPGIPLIAFGRDTPAATRSGYCGPLESDLGRAAALACESLVKGRSNSVILLHAGAENPTYSTRYNSFKTALSAASGVNLLKEVDCHANRVDALDLVKTEARKYPRAAGWVFLGDWPFRGLSEEDRLLPIGCGIVLCDGDPVYYERLRDGRIEALIGYDYRQAVQEAVYTAIRACEATDRGSLAPEISVAPEVITRKDLPLWEARWRAWCAGSVSPEPASRGP